MAPGGVCLAFGSAVFQRIVGPVVIEGMAWQRGDRTGNLRPGAYAHSRILCQKRHDDLDGLDGNAAAYFMNLMFTAGGQHLATGATGRAVDITPLIDGRALERWFLKFMCGAVVTGSIDQTQVVPDEWVTVYLGSRRGRTRGPCIAKTGTRRIEKSDGALHVEFHWREGIRLNGLFMRFLTMNTLFGIEPPDRTDGLLRRPILLGADVQRDHGGPALDSLAQSEHIRFELAWLD